MTASNRITGRKFVIKNLEELLSLVEIMPPSDLKLATDIIGKNQSLLVKRGQVLSPSKINYLKTHDSYNTNFELEPTPGLVDCCRNELKNVIRHLAVSKKIKALTQAILTIGKDIMPLINESLKDPRHLFSLFSLKAFGNENETQLLEHLIFVGVLCVGIARTLDQGFRNIELGVLAMQSGLLHDLAISNYPERVKQGQEALEEESHQSESANIATRWDMATDLVYAIRYHHAHSMNKMEIPEPQTQEAKVLHKALVTAEYYVTLLNVLGNKGKEEQALFLVANLAEQGKLDRDAVQALGNLIQTGQILSNVEMIARVENQCPHNSAYAYPKLVGMNPTQVICRAHFSECPLYLITAPTLNVVTESKTILLSENLMNLPPGTYAKCRLSDQLNAMLNHRESHGVLPLQPESNQPPDNKPSI